MLPLADRANINFSKALNLLFIANSLAISEGGPPRVIAEVGNGLRARGHHVRVVSRPAIGETVALNADVASFTLNFRVTNPFSVKTAAGELSNHLAWADCAFVSGVWGPLEGLVLRFAEWGDTPVHIRTCGMLEDYILRRNAWKKWLARRVFTDANLNKAASLIVNTKIEGDHVGKLGFRAPVDLIPNGVRIPGDDRWMSREAAIEALQITLQPEDRVILYLSRIHPKKGLHVLLEALPPLFAGNRKWQLVVAGEMFDGEGYRAKIARLTNQSGFAYKVHFLGEVAGRTKDACMSLGDIFVLPSESEGFSNAVLEAMAWGLPVVITEGCNFPEVAAGNAGWVVEQTRQGVQAALSEASMNFDDLATKGRNGRQMIADAYLIEHVVDAYERLAAEGK
jgi:glycosyltransferase involved in cell wall biosynthesis